MTVKITDRSPTKKSDKLSFNFSPGQNKFKEKAEVLNGHEKNMNFTERRASGRIPAVIECHCCNIECFGTITNISENGMFIRSQKISFPLDSTSELCISHNGEALNVRIKVSRITKTNGYYDGIGAELLGPSDKYLKYVRSL